ncbi:MAG TPA: hypothetical protein VFF88_00985 [Methylocella sp.]|nr:hypothetical protein [Methylocella sp.]
MLDDTRDRVIRMETEIKALTDQVRDLTQAVQELTALLNQIRGARIILAALIPLCGAIGGITATLFARG